MGGCGSIEVFLADPSVLRGHEKIDPNFNWMRAVTPEEARASLKRLTNWAKEHPKLKGGSLGEWVFQEKKYNTESGKNAPLDSYIRENEMTTQQEDEIEEVEPLRIQSLTLNAVQSTGRMSLWCMQPLGRRRMW